MALASTLMDLSVYLVGPSSPPFCRASRVTRTYFFSAAYESSSRFLGTRPEIKVPSLRRRSKFVRTSE
ncbi:hypothetical protein ACFFX0_25960 [Citricoccus parietis]|uniref:Uncharacterized protein n=1 Tax=Citricoccus parietis TaxID=592307 RepID=A0ABV5G746_9MICC